MPGNQLPSEGQLAAIHIQYRGAMASLARAYAEKISLLEKG